MRDIDFRGVFNRYDLGVGLNKGIDGIQKCRFTGCRGANDEGIHAFFEHQRQVSGDLVIQAAELNQFQDARRRAAKFTDGKVAAPFGNLAPVDNIDT